MVKNINGVSQTRKMVIWNGSSNSWITFVPVLFNPPLLITIQAVNELNPTNPTFSTCLIELRKICGMREILPKSSTISGTLLKTDDAPFASGSLADMHEGSLNDSKVCVEKVRMYSDGDPKGVKKVHNLPHPFSDFWFLSVSFHTPRRYFALRPSHGGT